MINKDRDDALLESTNSRVFLFWESSLKPIQKLEKLFQSKATLVHVLHSKLVSLCSDIHLRFIEADVIPKLKGRRLCWQADVFIDRKNQLSEELLIGDKARKFVKELKAYDAAIFYSVVRKYFERLTERLFHYLPLDNNLLASLIFLDPKHHEEVDFDQTVRVTASNLKNLSAFMFDRGTEC